MSAHPGSQCAKCGCDVHGEELCGWCEADVLRVALEEVRHERNVLYAALADAQRERDELKEKLTKAYDTIAWMKALPGVTRAMAESLMSHLRGDR